MAEQMEQRFAALEDALRQSRAREDEFFLGYTEEIQLEKNSGEERVLTRWWRVVRRLQRLRRVQRYFAYLGLYLKTKSPQILSDLKRHYPKEQTWLSKWSRGSPR